MQFAIVEKNNPLAVHGLFDSRERAERHLAVVIPEYVRKSYFMDKSLTADSFEIAIKISLPVKQGAHKPHAFQLGTEHITWCDVCGKSGSDSIHSSN